MYSDERLKGNIVPMNASLDKLMRINGYSFVWKDSVYAKEGHDIGLLAQELEKVFPELVVSDSAGYKKVYYYKLIPILVEAIKEQRKTIDYQNSILIKCKKDIEVTEKSMNDILIRLEELEKKKNGNAKNNF